MLCCLGPLQVGHKSMNIVWIHEVKLDEQSRPKVWQWHKFFFHLDYICDALWILLLVNLCKEWVFADLPILHNICCFLWFAGYQLLGQILMDGDLFLLTFESWWVNITFALWHGENAPCYFHHDMVHTAAIVTKLLLYELFVVCFWGVFLFCFLVWSILTKWVDKQAEVRVWTRSQCSATSNFNKFWSSKVWQAQNFCYYLNLWPWL